CHVACAMKMSVDVAWNGAKAKRPCGPLVVTAICRSTPDSPGLTSRTLTPAAPCPLVLLTTCPVTCPVAANPGTAKSKRKRKKRFIRRENARRSAAGQQETTADTSRRCLDVPTNDTFY